MFQTIQIELQMVGGTMSTVTVDLTTYAGSTDLGDGWST